MLNFKKITAEDVIWIREALKNTNGLTTEFTISGNLFYGLFEEYHFKAALINGMFCGISDKGKETRYLFPKGNKDLKTTMDILMKDAKKRGVCFRLFGITKEECDWLEDNYPNRFQFKELSGFADYIFDTEEFINLDGKKFEGIRRKIRKFKKNNQWESLSYHKDYKDECKELLQLWGEGHQNQNSVSFQEDMECTIYLLDYFEELNLKGRVIKVDGKIEGFELGEVFPNQLAAVGFVEKANRNIDGLYQTLRHEFVAKECSHVKHFNFTCDMGEEGLKDSKMRYHPIQLCSKFEGVAKMTFFKKGCLKVIFKIKNQIGLRN